jgi:hypothetical protein
LLQAAIPYNIKLTTGIKDNIAHHPGLLTFSNIFHLQATEKIVKTIAVIPPKIIEEVGFKEGEELDVKVKNGKIILEKK